MSLAPAPLNGPSFVSASLLLLVAAVLQTNSVSADLLEPLPEYSDSRSMREDSSLQAVAFNPQGVGIACGYRGTILRSEDGGQSWSLQESGLDCLLEDVVWLDSARAVIVGGTYDRITGISRGVVLFSSDGGGSWERSPDQELPRVRTVRAREDGSLAITCDWSHSLLTRTLESHDGGRTWQTTAPGEADSTFANRTTAPDLVKWTVATGVNAPIRDACRTPSGLCAVGDHGVILISQDGGRSWTPSRGENRHSAILCVAATPQSAAWSMLGSESLESRNRCALLVHRDGPDAANGPLQLDLVRRAAAVVGASGADAIGSQGDQPNSEALHWITIHRPAVLLLDRELPAEVHDAFFQAATSAGVHRVIQYSLDGEGNTALHKNALLPKSGILASDLFSDAMLHLAPTRLGNPSTQLRYLYDLAAATRRGDSIASGVPLDAGQTLSAPARQATRRQLQILQARMNQTERIRELVSGHRRADRFAQSLAMTLDQTAKQDQFRLAWRMVVETVASNRQAGLAEMHEAALREFASRFPGRSAGRWATLRLEAIRHSIEWQRLRSTTMNDGVASTSMPSAQSVVVSPFQVSESDVRQVSALSPVLVPEPESPVPVQSSTEKEVDVDLNWEFHPLVLISREAARGRGDDGTLQVAGEESANLKRLTDAGDNAWTRLLTSGGVNVIHARRAQTRPKLDGVLDDECWQSALPSAGKQERIRMAYDDDFVYLAVQLPANELAPDAYRGRSTSDARDHDLTDVDRLQVRIDTDRDLMTAMQLQSSDAGRTHDAIDGDARWQPTWYVDVRRGEDQVTVETAILRRDLVDLPIPRGESWFVSAQSQRAKTNPAASIIPTPNQWVRVDFK